MPTSNPSHRRTHNLLLIDRLLSQHENASPFTLVQDTLEQPAHSLIEEVIARAKKSKVHVIYLSFETPFPPPGIHGFIKGRRKPPSAIHKEVAEAASKTSKTLLLIDPLPPSLLQTPQTFLLPLLSLPPPASISIFLSHHTDVPFMSDSANATNPYAPTPLTLLSYLATTIITLHSFAQVLAKKRARDRSLPEPVFGLEEEKEGVLIGLVGPEERDVEGVVLEVEFRRKSGRGIGEVYLLPPSPTSGGKSEIMLLDEHPLMRAPASSGDEGISEKGREEGVSTFSLELSERQRRDREGVVLPYFDAQKVGGGGEGGRILYEMGKEDDFDEEEDEI